MRISLSLFFLLTFQALAFAAGGSFSPDRITRGITAEGSCAVVGMSAEQSQLTALQRARAAAIEQAAGVGVSSSTLVTDFKLAADFIKTYSKGYVVREKVEWLPLGQYQKDSSMAPIPEYRVRIVADVYVPEPKIKPLGLQAKSNNAVYRCGETARMEVRTGAKAKIAVFNIMANDEVVMLFPNEYDKCNLASQKEPLVFPGKDSSTELVMQTLPGHERDAEAFFVVALDATYPKEFTDYFAAGRAMRLEEFFRRYAEIADYAEDAIVTYEVVGK